MGKDPVETPDLMRWQVWDVGTRSGSMQNALSVPNAASVRIDIDVRQDVAYAEAPPNSHHAVTVLLLQNGGDVKLAACLPRDRPDRYADQSEQLMVHHSGPPE